VKLTEKVISGLCCGAGQKDRLIFDDVVTGLGVRVSASGRKNFLVQFRGVDGVKKRLPLGAWGALTLEQARQAAKAAVGQLATGKDPVDERRSRRAVALADREASRLTLAVLLQEWAEIGLAERRDGYRREAVRAVSFAFHRYLNRPAAALQRKDAVSTLDGLVKDGKRAMASRTLAYGRACYSWAVKRGLMETNPFAGLPIPTATASRDRVLTDEEIGAIYRAADGLGYPFGPLIQLLLLTAQRRDEVAAMRWGDISADGMIWTVPADVAKNHKAHVVQLAPEAQAIVAALSRGTAGDFLFSTNGKTHVSGFSKARERLDRLVEGRTSNDWRFHDFRRTCVTWLAHAGFNPAVADKLLNHTTATGLTTVGQVYQRAEYLPERRAALEAWARHVIACASGSDDVEDRVIQMRRG
jgi:integrase